jgi:branched-subunit amino acid transport protein
MNAAWLTIILLALGTFLIKAAGPLILGERELPERLRNLIALLVPALLAALIVTEVFGGDDRKLHLDFRLVGLGVAALALVLRLPMIAVIVLAAGATALARLVF